MVSPREPFAAEQPGSFLRERRHPFPGGDPGRRPRLCQRSRPRRRHPRRRKSSTWAPAEKAAGVRAAEPAGGGPDRQSGTNARALLLPRYLQGSRCGRVAASSAADRRPGGELILEAGGGNLYRRNPDGTYTLITDLPPEALERSSDYIYTEFTLAGMNEDCSRVYFSTVHHYAGVPGAKAGGLYEWSEADGLRYAGFVPKEGGGEEAVEASAGGYSAVSTDASRLFFSATRLTGGVSGESARQGSSCAKAASSTDISASADPDPRQGANYQGATADGSKVYFTANARPHRRSERRRDRPLRVRLRKARRRTADRPLGGREAGRGRAGRRLTAGPGRRGRRRLPRLLHRPRASSCPERARPWRATKRRRPSRSMTATPASETCASSPRCGEADLEHMTLASQG